MSPLEPEPGRLAFHARPRRFRPQRGCELLTLASERKKSGPPLCVLAQLLVTMPQPEFPVALGVLLRQPGVAFEKAYYAAQPTQLKRTGRVADVLRQTSIWRVPAAK